MRGIVVGLVYLDRYLSSFFDDKLQSFEDFHCHFVHFLLLEHRCFQGLHMPLCVLHFSKMSDDWACFFQNQREWVLILVFDAGAQSRWDTPALQSCLWRRSCEWCYFGGSISGCSNIQLREFYAAGGLSNWRQFLVSILLKLHSGNCGEHICGPSVLSHSVDAVIGPDALPTAIFTLPLASVSGTQSEPYYHNDWLTVITTKFSTPVTDRT